MYANALLREPETGFARDDSAAGSGEYLPISSEELVPHDERVKRALVAQPHPTSTSPTGARRKPGRCAGRRSDWVRTGGCLT